MRTLLFVAALALPAVALADQPASLYLGVGLLGGGSGHPGGDVEFDLGGELTLNYQFFKERDVYGGKMRVPGPWVVGGFAQAEAVKFDRLRVAAGAQATWLFAGLEAGMAWEEGDAAHAGTAYVHVAPYVSLVGVISVALRIDLPVASGAGLPAWGYDLGIVATIKAPIALNGTYPRSEY